MNSNIKNIRTYQGVKFNNNVDTFFTTEKTYNKAAGAIEFYKEIGVVLKSKSDEIIVPFANISGISLYTEEDLKKSSEVSAEAKPKINKIKIDPLDSKTK